MATVTAQGNARVATSFISYTPTASSEAAGFPATNVTVLERPRRAWRSTATGEQWIVLDFGSAQSVPAVFLDNLNFTTVQIQGNPTDSWTSPAFDTGAVTIAKDPRFGRYKRLIDLTGFNYQFMRVLIPSQTPVDGASYYKIGAIAIPASITTMNESIEYPLRYEPRQAVVENRFVAGGSERVKLAPLPSGSVFITVRRSNDGTNVQQIYDLFGERGRTILFDANLTESYESYLCRVATDVMEEWRSWNPRDYGEIELEVTA